MRSSGLRTLGVITGLRLLAQTDDRNLPTSVGMSEHDSFEDRMRAIADQISQSMQRIADVDLEQLAEDYGVDVDRAPQGIAIGVVGEVLGDVMAPRVVIPVGLGSARQGHQKLGVVGAGGGIRRGVDGIQRWSTAC